MSVKRGDVVLLSWQQKTYNAIVLGLNSTNDSHLGANGEPALHLAVLFDEPLINGKPKPLPIGELPQVSYQYDVVHASHVFPDDFKELHGAEAHKHRGAGEWSETVVLEKTHYDHLEAIHLASIQPPALFGGEPSEPEPPPTTPRKSTWGKDKK